MNALSVIDAIYIEFFEPKSGLESLDFIYSLTSISIHVFITYYYGYKCKGSKWLLFVLCFTLPMSLLREMPDIQLSMNESLIEGTFVLILGVGLKIYYGITTFYLRKKKLKTKLSQEKPIIKTIK